MGSNAMDIDEVFERIGQFGPYQIKLFFALNLLVNAAAAFQVRLIDYFCLFSVNFFSSF